MTTLNVVSDIDEVLSISHVNTIEQLHFFSDFGALITANKRTYFLLPGVREFFQWLHTIENIRVSFFSAGPHVRNIDFVHSLYQLSFPKTHVQMTKDLQILSRHDLTPCEISKKDITKALAPGDLLEQAVLIDDNEQNIVTGQVKNFLLTPKTSIKTYEKLHGKCWQYTPDGFKAIPYYLMNSLTAQNMKSPVLIGKMIQVVSHEGYFELRFINHLTGTVQNEVISQEKHPSMVTQLSKLYSLDRVHQGETIRIQDMDLLLKLMDYVSNKEGRIKKLCRAINRIYYVAGLLFTASERSKKNGTSIADSLFKWQFTSEQKPRHSFLKKQDNLYWIGLRKMQEVHPQLRFLSPHDYVSYKNKSIPEEKQIDFMCKFLSQYTFKASL